MRLQAIPAGERVQRLHAEPALASKSFWPSRRNCRMYLAENVNTSGYLGGAGLRLSDSLGLFHNSDHHGEFRLRLDPSRRQLLKFPWS
jgi:hypothetical protein